MEADLMNLIIGKIVNKDFEDSIVWSGDNKGVFSVKSAYLTLCNSFNGAPHNVFSMLWQAKAVSKDVFTAWRALLGRLPTYDNLINRGLAVNSSMCVLCKAAEESSRHIFMNCIFAQWVWFICLWWIIIKQNQVWKGFVGCYCPEHMGSEKSDCV